MPIPNVKINEASFKPITAPIAKQTDIRGTLTRQKTSKVLTTKQMDIKEIMREETTETGIAKQTDFQATLMRQETNKIVTTKQMGMIETMREETTEAGMNRNHEYPTQTEIRQGGAALQQYRDRTVTLMQHCQLVK